MRLLTTALLTATLILAGCDYLAKKELKPGVSTVAQVREYMGLPDTIWEEPDGTQIHEYPMGLNTYMIVIDKSGVYQSMTDVLVPAQFAKIVVGTNKATVRRLLGRPSDVEYFSRTKDEVWTYRHTGKIDAKAFFHVYFDQAGRVTKTATMMDYDPGGN